MSRLRGGARAGGNGIDVGWHSDIEPLFGEREEAKLVVSVSFGTRTLFKWKGKSLSDGDASSCWLDHGDILGHGWSMPGRVSSLHKSQFGTGTG